MLQPLTFIKIMNSTTEEAGIKKEDFDEVMAKVNGSAETCLTGSVWESFKSQLLVLHLLSNCEMSLKEKGIFGCLARPIDNVYEDLVGGMIDCGYIRRIKDESGEAWLSPTRNLVHYLLRLQGHK